LTDLVHVLDLNGKWFTLVDACIKVVTFFFARFEIESMSDDRKKMTLEWKGNFRFEAKNPHGLTVSFDAPKKYGGDETAPSPMETLLACLAGCTSFDVVNILKKKRQSISGYWVEIEGERRDEPPEVFTKIQIKYKIKGKNVSKEAVERAIQLSNEKYCSVGAILKKTAEITTSYEIIQE
jgi:putative redox protein